MILTFDIGTTAVKAALFGEDMRLLAGESVEYQLLAPGNAWVELEPRVYWEGMGECMGRLLTRRPEAADRVRARWGEKAVSSARALYSPP